MIIPLWREGIVILLFAEWWKGRNKIQSPDSTVEKLFLSLFFSCMYILLLFSLLSLSLSFFAFIVFTRTFSATTLRNIAFSQTQSDFVPFSFRGNIEFPLPSALSHLEIESPDGDLFWRNLYRLRSSGNATLRAQLLPRLLRGNFIMRFRE